MANISNEEIVEAVLGKPVIEVIELVKLLEEKCGVSAAAFAAPVMAAPAASEKAEEEKTEFTVVLKDFGANKIAVIKVIREITGLGLKEAKDVVEGVPSSVKEGIAKKEAEEIKKKLEEAGASVELK